MEINKEIERVYNKYKKLTNMTFTELLIWSKNPASQLASIDRRPILRNLRLLSKNKRDWNFNDVENANKTISFISRMKKVKSGRKIYRNLSKRDISLLNWAFNPYKRA